MPRPREGQDYIPPTYRPNYTPPRKAPTPPPPPAQRPDRDYWEVMEQRRIERQKQAEIEAANRRMKALQEQYRQQMLNQQRGLGGLGDSSFSGRRTPSYLANWVTKKYGTINRPSLQELVARGLVDPRASDPYEIGGIGFGSSRYSPYINPQQAWKYDPNWAAELRSNWWTPQVPLGHPSLDPWSFDPYEPGGDPYGQKYSEKDDGYGGYGGGWGGWGGGGDYSSSPGILGDSARRGQWFNNMISWNL